MTKLNNLLIYGNQIQGRPEERVLIKEVLDRGGMVYLKNGDQQQLVEQY